MCEGWVEDEHVDDIVWVAVGKGIGTGSSEAGLIMLRASNLFVGVQGGIVVGGELYVSVRCKNGCGDYLVFLNVQRFLIDEDKE
ncbi:9191_t:CDS:2 [Gigaspora rosea]|nr:9191_t:CDS:2 [Gigaspora rosea]